MSQRREGFRTRRQLENLYNDNSDYSDNDNYDQYDYLDDYFRDDEDDYSLNEFIHPTIYKSTNNNPKYNFEFNNVNFDIFITNLNINKNDLDLKHNKKIFIGELPTINNLNLNLFQLNDLIEFQKITYAENKHEYFTKKKIFTLILESGGGVFGGFIRDHIIHDYGSILFYDFLEIENIYNGMNKLINILYCNKDIYPETYIERNTIFNDIDCIMNMNQFNILKNSLDSFDIKYEYYILNEFNKYMDIIDIKDQIKTFIPLWIYINNPFDIENLKDFPYSTNFKANLNFKKYKSCVFKLDILICRENILIKDALDNITSNSDFYCNSLYIYNYSLEINKNIAQNLKNQVFTSSFNDENKKNIDIFFKQKFYISDVIEIVKKQIFEKKAVSLNLEKRCQYRIDKMKLKGFNIIYFQSIFDEIYCKDEICLICRSEFLENTLNIKFKCCNSYFHRECLYDWINKKEIKKCFLCSKVVDFNLLKNILN